MRPKLLVLPLALLFTTLTGKAFAQDPPKFQPRPPSEEFDDPDDEFDQADAPNKGQPPPPPPAAAQPPPPMNDFRPAAPPSPTDPGKIHFKVVDGQFYEKGKPRGRAPINKRLQ